MCLNCVLSYFFCDFDLLLPISGYVDADQYDGRHPISLVTNYPCPDLQTAEPAKRVYRTTLFDVRSQLLKSEEVGLRQIGSEPSSCTCYLCLSILTTTFCSLFGATTLLSLYFKQIPLAATRRGFRTTNYCH